MDKDTNCKNMAGVLPGIVPTRVLEKFMKSRRG